MELICHELCVWEKIFGKTLVGIREIKHYVFYVLSALDVRESVVELARRSAEHEISGPAIIVIDDYGGKLSKTAPPRDKVLIDANRSWPRIVEFVFQADSQMLFHGLVDEPGRAAVFLSHAL